MTKVRVAVADCFAGESGASTLCLRASSLRSSSRAHVVLGEGHQKIMRVGPPQYLAGAV
jgi:hypothetical protein